MKNIPSILSVVALLILGSLATAFMTAAPSQAPAAGAPATAPAPAGQGAPAGARAGGGGRGRGGLPGATPEQTEALAAMNTALTDLAAAVATARAALATATFADVRNAGSINAAVEKVRAAELALATKRAEEFAKLQNGPHKLNPEQVSALIAAGGNPGAGRGGGGGGAAGAGGGRGAGAPGAPATPPAGRGN